MLAAEFTDPKQDWLAEILRSIEPPRDKDGKQWFADVKTMLLDLLDKKRPCGELKSWSSTDERLVVEFGQGEPLSMAWPEVAHLYNLVRATE